MARILLAAAGIACFLGLGSASRQPFVTMIALESRRTLGDGQLAAWLASRQEDLAVRAALAIGRTKQPAGDELLAAHLRDSRAAVRAMSVYALGLLATGKETAGLILALGDPNSAVRLAAVDALDRYQAAGRLAPASSGVVGQAIVHALASDPNPIVRARAAAALVEFAKSGIAASAARMLERVVGDDSNVQVRRHAMWAIYRGFASRAGRQVIERALRDPDEVVRIETVRAAGQSREPALAASIRPLLGDPSWRVQEQAQQALRILAGKPPAAHWKVIPAYVRVPGPQPDPLAALPALPRAPAEGKPAPPMAGDAIVTPAIDPRDAAEMTQPAPGPHPRVRIVTTQGNLYVVLFPEWAPLTVENFLNLAGRGYYDGNPWFRIVPDFVVQTGDPRGDENGDAGYAIPAEENPLEQHSYVISMGLNYDDKTGTPIRDSAGTQYYITLSPQYHLDRDFTVFGEVTAGTGVLGRLVESDRVIRIERIPDATF